MTRSPTARPPRHAMRSVARGLGPLGLGLMLSALAGCTVNPATGEQSFTAFMSRSDELKVGRQEHPKILRQFGGAYDDPALAQYIQGIGLSLAGVTEAPNLPYTFTVLNDQKVNAFALPGGYVYITRGLLAMADNEAEVAGVLAHELGHVVARHSAQRYSTAVATGFGATILGAIGNAVGLPVDTSNLVSFGARAILQGYSREQESEADMLAVRYMTRVHYSPYAMVSFFRKLEAEDRLQAVLSGRSETTASRFNIMSSHPLTSDRLRHVARLAEAAPPGANRIARDAYLDHIDGLLFGDDPKEGVRRGRVFSHPGLRIRFVVPPGFVMINTPKEVLARGKGNSAILFDMISGEKARRVSSLPAYVARRWGRRLALREVEPLTINGMAAATGHAQVQTRSGNNYIRLLAVRGGPDRIFRFIFVTAGVLGEPLATEFRRTTYSFRRLTAKEAAAIRPLRIKVIRVKRGDTVESLAARMPLASHRLEWFEALNGLSRGAALSPGQRLKTVVQ